MNEKKPDDQITEIKIRLAKLEDNHDLVMELHDEWPILEARVSNLEKSHTIIDNVQRRVDKIEANLEIITTKVSAIDDSTKRLTIDISEFKENMRGEFNRLLKWVAVIIIGSLFGGLATMYQYQGNAFKTIGIKINEVECESARKCSEIEKDMIRMDIKIDTLRRK